MARPALPYLSEAQEGAHCMGFDLSLHLKTDSLHCFSR